MAENTVTWDDIINSIGNRLWELAPNIIREQTARDLTFTVTWQDLMGCVEDGIADFTDLCEHCGQHKAVTTLSTKRTCESCYDEIQAVMAAEARDGAA